MYEIKIWGKNDTENDNELDEEPMNGKSNWLSVREMLR